MELSSIPNSIYNAGASIVNGVTNAAAQAWSYAPSSDAIVSTVSTIAKAIFFSKDGQITILSGSATYAFTRAVAKYNAAYIALTIPPFPGTDEEVITKEKRTIPAQTHIPSYTDKNGVEVAEVPAQLETEEEVEVKKTVKVGARPAIAPSRLACLEVAKKPLLVTIALVALTVIRANN